MILALSSSIVRGSSFDSIESYHVHGRQSTKRRRLPCESFCFNFNQMYHLPLEFDDIVYTLKFWPCFWSSKRNVKILYNHWRNGSLSNWWSHANASWNKLETEGRRNPACPTGRVCRTSLRGRRARAEEIARIAQEKEERNARLAQRMRMIIERKWKVMERFKKKMIWYWRNY